MSLTSFVFSCVARIECLEWRGRSERLRPGGLECSFEDLFEVHWYNIPVPVEEFCPFFIWKLGIRICWESHMSDTQQIEKSKRQPAYPRQLIIQTVLQFDCALTISTALG
jgi:hypothetical protein